MTVPPTTPAAVLDEAPDPSDVLERVLRVRAVEVLERTRDLLRTFPVSEVHRELLELHLGECRSQMAAQPDLPAAQLPLLVHEDLAGEYAPALPVGVACTLLYLGADLFDAQVDGELPDIWRGRSAAEVHLAAATLLATGPALALAELANDGFGHERLWRLTHEFAKTLLVMSAGEYDDLRVSGRDEVTLRDCRAIAERKGAVEFALFARAGAARATEDTAITDAYWEFGLNLGAAATIAGDAADLWHGDPSQDLLTGKRSLPVVHALNSLEGRGRREFAALLRAACDSPDVHDDVRRVLLDVGSLRYTALVVGVYKQRAAGALERAGRGSQARGQLLAYLERFFITPIADLTLDEAFAS